MSSRMVAFILLWIAVTSTAMGVVISKHESRQLFHDMQILKQERDDLQIEWGQLQLEQSSWATHGRIEQLARKEIKMKIPRVGDTVMVLP